MPLFTTHKDAVDTDDFGIAAVLWYSGYPLVEMSRPSYPPGANFTFTFLCPQLDYEDIVTEYERGTLSLSNSKQFVMAFHEITKRIREIRKSGELCKTWVTKSK